MAIHQLYHVFKDWRKLFFFFGCSLTVLMMVNIYLDYLLTQLQSSSFYFSESLLFSSFWLLFTPLLCVQFYLIKKTKNLTLGLLIISSAIVAHLTIYPIFIWFLSKIFYDHTFPYGQTFSFGITAYLIKTVLVYSSSFIIFTILKNKVQTHQPAPEETTKQNTITSMVVSEVNHKKIVIEVCDIFYFSANSPYINIHHRSKKYLHSDTLKSLETQLSSDQFVRIHKSHIVNIHHIISYQSRQNGDYDITLSDDTILRVSRNYAKDFKSKLESLHLTSK
ncbi:LytR/AlgR family response regulator transcription factor [Chryseobacterium herbae]|uniref:LytTR family transcriptional regulator n=1 Tax=Chryseobacterium herbae TaxID=2976476 RepID=A0ABT2IUN9_9FLAO|nr:LytTR family DNA-binding domain-containing protein [Chryseobacterium sp. pc1-10]MCT2562502.1 LytTR family transcriptional regulator [Chryseobacterium sp. pc1-10]